MSVGLSRKHFAHNWEHSKEKNDVKIINNLAISFITSQEEQEKQEIFLSILKQFHNYICKYVLMITKGQFPSLNTTAGRESGKFLYMFMPKCGPYNYFSYQSTCKSLHLGFKQLTIDEVYDTLVSCFLTACNKYDPEFSNKVKKVYDYIKENLKIVYTINDLSSKFDFNPSTPLRWMAKKTILVSVKENNKITGYKRGPGWKCDSKIFNSGPVGFTHFVQFWFRYYLNDYISKSMNDVETQEGFMQLNYFSSSSENSGQDDLSELYSLLPSNIEGKTQGNFFDTLDIGKINDAWVNSTDHKLFKNMTKRQRWLLKMVFVDELSWVDIGQNLHCTATLARKEYNEVLQYLKYKYKV